MAYLVTDLINDVIQRGARIKNDAGLTIVGAANSVQSIITKRLVDRGSDLVATGNLALSIAAQGCQATLPSGFIAMAEKPQSQDIYTDWMMGTVSSYDNVAGNLVVNVTQSSGTDTLDDWTIALVPPPGGNSTTIGTSISNIVVGAAGTQVTITTQAGLSAQLPVNTSIYIIPSTMPTDLSPYPSAGQRTLQPNYLNDDSDHNGDNLTWWSWYGLYGWEWYPPAVHPRYYKIVGTIMYIRPYAIVPISITGLYFGLPSTLVDGPSPSTIPYNGLFDEVFREGVIRALQLGTTLLDTDAPFFALIMREVDSVLTRRMHILPKTRTHRNSFM